MSEVLMLTQTIIVGGALVFIGWQAYQLRQAIQTVSCQDIVAKFFHMVEKLSFRQTFDFHTDGE